MRAMTNARAAESTLISATLERLAKQNRCVNSASSKTPDERGAHMRGAALFYVIFLAFNASIKWSRRADYEFNI